MASLRRIGIMGGTFNPIHNGHLITAEEARWAFSLDQVLFVPAGQPWQKERGVDVAEAEHRYLMTVIATATNPAFVVDRIELDRAGPTYTVETLRELHRRAPEIGRAHV
jgi:nicotinate-nucleotide adenylyltransferase